MPTPSDQQDSTPKEPQPLLLTAHSGGVQYPDDEGQWIHLDVDRRRTLIFSEPEPPPGVRDSTDVEHSYHVTILEDRGAGRARVSFGGVVSVVLRSGVLSLTFTAEAAAELRLPSPEVRITLDLKPSTIARIATALRVVFGTGPVAFRARLIDVDR